MHSVSVGKHTEVNVSREYGLFGTLFIFKAGK
jgi:hypothetical protein